MIDPLLTFAFYNRCHDWIGGDADLHGVWAMSVEWRDEFSVGNDMIDGDHRTLIAIINEYETVLETKDIGRLKDVYQRLFDYAEMHFDREINLQKAVHFPGYLTHQSKHDDLLRQLTEIHTAFVEGTERKGIIPKTTQLLRGWLLQHILTEDLKLRPYVAGERGDTPLQEAS